MREELVSFVLENKLSPFTEAKNSTSMDADSIFKTKDARAVHTKVLNQISENFTSLTCCDLPLLRLLSRALFSLV